MAEMEKLGIGHERLRLSQAAGFEPLAAPDEQFPGGGYARVEVNLLNETTGAKLAQHGAKTKSRVKVRDTSHTSDKQPAKANDSHDVHSTDTHADKPAGTKPPTTPGHAADDHHKPADAGH